MKTLLLSLTLLSTICIGSDYQPPVGASAEQIFNDACMACHGDNGTGKFGLFFDLTSSTLQVEEAKVIIHQGGLMMPAFPNINSNELDALLTYLVSLRPVLAAKE